MDNSAELNRLVREMNDGPEAGSADSSATARLDHWLTTLVSRAGSDLLLVENAPPCIRVQGELRKIESDVLDGADVEAAVVPALSAHALRVYRESLIADSSYRIAGVAGFELICIANVAARLPPFVPCPQRSLPSRICIFRLPWRIWRVCLAAWS